ncbi:MAG: hypothetical protein LBT47_09015 [Deltaproteobacteria bacterium]|jgi:hypothetical protein|nr:hypothetical protein [Deltaproteobacteria bacterium]
MATDLTIGEKAAKNRPGYSCNDAQQCLWYETTAPTSNICANRETLACHKRCEEVFGDNCSDFLLKTGSNS